MPTTGEEHRCMALVREAASIELIPSHILLGVSDMKLLFWTIFAVEELNNSTTSIRSPFRAVQHNPLNPGFQGRDSVVHLVYRLRKV